MAKERVKPTKKISDELMKEFNYRCAICGKDNPQIHHIDENPANNDPMNLIPICPNHHLLDVHNPTQPIDQRKLCLFRKYRDPAILSSMFHPLFIRMFFLFNIANDTTAYELEEKCEELIRFIAELEMGKFYSEKIKELTAFPGRVITLDEYPPHYQQENMVYDNECRELLQNNQEEIISLTIELLRYQNWQQQNELL
jgi:hypothetical protein